MPQIKLITKLQSFDDVNKSLQEVEKNLNKLFEAVNQKADKQADDTKGKTGDLQITQEADKSHSLKVKSDEGWRTPVLTPHYDSRWIDVTKNTTYTFSHNLDSKILLVQIYFKTDTGEIFNLSHVGMAEAHNAPTNTDTGITVQMSSNNSISVGTGIYYITNSYKVPFDNYGWENIANGYLRILAWKIGKSDK